MTYLEAALEVLNLIETHSFQAFFVGGFVRDHILGIEANDIDIATNALPSQIANIFEVVNTGIKFNSVTILYQGYEFETTTYRIDLDYKDNRHPVCCVADSLVDDLKRRDFTINAMAMDKNFKIVDIFDGQKDLDNKIIRTVYDPIKRFTEDALRMLRACYFAAKLDFTIANDTLDAIKKSSHLIQCLSNDRILWELEKIVKSKNPMKGFDYLLTTNILPYLLLFKDGISLIIEKDIHDLNWVLFLCLCFYSNPEALNEIHIKAELRRQISDSIELSRKALKNDFDNIELFDYGLEIALLANQINVYQRNSKDNSVKIKSNYDKLVIHSMIELNLKAQDIIDGVKLQNKKSINEILLDVKEKVLNKKIDNNREKILKYIKKYYS